MYRLDSVLAQGRYIPGRSSQELEEMLKLLNTVSEPTEQVFKVPEFIQDRPEFFGPSEQRLILERKPKTRTGLEKSLGGKLDGDELMHEVRKQLSYFNEHGMLCYRSA